MELLLLFWFVVGLICAVVCTDMMRKKNRSALDGLFLGLVLGVFGVLIAAVLPAAEARAPRGMIRVKCLRCDAVQNVPKSDDTVECWQCKRVIDLRPATA